MATPLGATVFYEDFISHSSWLPLPTLQIL